MGISFIDNAKMLDYSLRIPSRCINAFIEGSCPRKRLYNSIGSSVPPFSRIFFLKDSAISRLKIPFSLNKENASASRT